MTELCFMKEAIKEANKAWKIDEVPIGAVVVYNGKIIARAHNKKETKQNPISHAEIEVLQKASRKLGSWRLEDCDLYVTLEPCPMCAGAIMQARVRHIYYGAADPKGGAAGTLFNLYDISGFNHYPKVTKGVMAAECGELLTNYFKEKRNHKKQQNQSATI